SYGASDSAGMMKRPSRESGVPSAGRGGGEGAAPDAVSGEGDFEPQPAPALTSPIASASLATRSTGPVMPASPPRLAGPFLDHAAGGIDHQDRAGERNLPEQPRRALGAPQLRREGQRVGGAVVHGIAEVLERTDRHPGEGIERTADVAGHELGAEGDLPPVRIGRAGSTGILDRNRTETPAHPAVLAHAGRADIRRV